MCHAYLSIAEVRKQRAFIRSPASTGVVIMKSTFALLSILLCLGCANTPRSGMATPPLATSKKLIGTWSGTDNTGKKGEIIFFASGNLILEIGGNRIGDRFLGSPFEVTYKVTTNTRPYELDIFAKDDGVDMGVLRCLLEIIDDQTIRVGIADGFEQPRPSSFSSLSDSSAISLKKIK